MQQVAQVPGEHLHCSIFRGLPKSKAQVCAHAATTTPAQRLGVLFAHLTQPCQPSPERSRVGLHIDLFEIPWRVGCSDRFPDKVRGLPPFILKLTMNITTDQLEAPTAIRTDLGAIFVSLELSRSSWLITSLSPGGGEKMSKACGAWRRCERAAEALFATQGEGAGTDGEGLPADRHSGSWARWLLDRSGAAK
jgi:hypothetical protein